MPPGNTATKTLNVLHVAPQLSTGGLEKLLVEFAKHTNAARCRLRFLAMGTRGRPADEIEALGWSVAALEQPGGLRPQLILQLARLLREWRIDVVHTHNNGPLMYAGPAARLAGVRVVVHTRHGQNYRIGARECRLFRWATTCANHVVCVSEDSAKLSHTEGIAPARVRTIWNGIDITRFAYAGAKRGGPVVTVARLSPEKDIATLVRAAKAISQQAPEFRLEIAGEGPCMNDLRMLAGELNLEQHVRFLGEVRDIPGLLSKASLFVLPSLTEGISLTLLEAMARGLPIVATHVGGNPEVIVEGETGLLVPVQQPEQLAGAILSVLRNPARGEEMGAAGRRRIEEHFDAKKMVAAYEALYRGEGASRATAPANFAASREPLNPTGSATRS